MADDGRQEASVASVMAPKRKFEEDGYEGEVKVMKTAADETNSTEEINTNADEMDSTVEVNSSTVEMNSSTVEMNSTDGEGHSGVLEDDGLYVYFAQDPDWYAGDQVGIVDMDITVDVEEANSLVVEVGDLEQFSDPEEDIGQFADDDAEIDFQRRVSAPLEFDERFR